MDDREPLRRPPLPCDTGTVRWNTQLCRHEYFGGVRFSEPRHTLVVAVAVVCLLGSVVGVGVVAGTSGVTGDTEGPSPSVIQETATPTNNTTQQENPDEVNEQGDTAAVRSYLAQKLAERLGESSRQISQRQYEQGQAVLGDEYNDLLDKYVDVEGGTDDNPASESFEEASEDQKEYASDVEEYNETYQEYQEAKQAGNTTRARELARELNRIANRVDESGEQVNQSYTRVENTTGADLSEAQQNIQDTTEQVQEQQQEVVETTFVRTNLTVRTDATAVSFENPATVAGRLVRANGTAIANETIRIRIGEWSETVRTDDEGRFTVEYRPVSVGQDTDSIDVEYLPTDNSVYLGSTASFDVAVTQVTADLTVSTDTTAAQFGDTVVVSGQLSDAGTPVPGARVRVTLGGETLGTVTTNVDGSYQLTTTLSESVPTGEATVEAVVVPSNAAVRSDPATTSIQVEPTAVSLTVNATALTDSRLQLSGTLQTVDGRPLAGQTVELRVGGTTVATVETRRDGTFERTVTLSESLTGEVTVHGIFDDPSTNLQRATAETRVDLDTETEVGESLPVSLELLGGGGVIVLSLLAIAWLVRREDEPTVPEPSTVQSEGSDGTPVDPNLGRDIVEQAASLLSADDSEAAIRALYAAVRNSISTDDSSLTHWEFYAAVNDRLTREAAGTLERLTEEYERVVYSPEGTEPATAERLLDESKRLVGDDGEEPSHAD